MILVQEKLQIQHGKKQVLRKEHKSETYRPSGKLWQTDRQPGNREVSLPNKKLYTNTDLKLNVIRSKPTYLESTQQD